MSDKLEQLNQQLHQLIQTVRLTQADDRLLEQTTETLQGLNEQLKAHQFEGVTCALGLDFNAINYDPTGLQPSEITPYSPITGRFNPLSPHLNLQANDDGTVTGIAAFPVSFCGPPDTIHGGFVAAIFDELLSAVNIANTGLGGMTANLSVNYKKPTPIYADIELYAEVKKAEGRKTIAYGELRYNGEVTATAEALFVVPRAYASG